MIVCVMGPSGSGKSTLVKRLQELRPELFARVPVDYFFVPREPGMSLADYLAHPFAYDWPTLDRARGAAQHSRVRLHGAAPPIPVRRPADRDRADRRAGRHAAASAL